VSKIKVILKSRYKKYRKKLIYFLLKTLGVSIGQNGLRKDDILITGQMSDHIIGQNGLRKDDILITRQLSDHIISFNPHDLIGRRLYIDGTWAKDVFDKVIDLLSQNELLNRKKIVCRSSNESGPNLEIG